jgi:hypothetical protein
MFVLKMLDDVCLAGTGDKLVLAPRGYEVGRSARLSYTTDAGHHPLRLTIIVCEAKGFLVL